MVRFSVAPMHNGLLLDGEGAAGIGLTMTVVVPATLVQPFTVTVTEYVPAAASVAPVTEVFCCVSVNPFGPVQLYVAPATFDAARFRLSPSQIGPLLDAVGAAGVGFTVTVTVPALPVQPLTVMVSEYVPAAASVTFVMFGFCKVDENAFGPVQLYVAPATAPVVRLSVPPVQTGLLAEADGAAGIGLTTTATVPAALVQPFTVIVTEYVPASAEVAPGMDGFCNAEVNPFGPVQEYVAPATKFDVRFSVFPSQIGLLLPAVGVAGVGFTVTVVVAGELAQPLLATTVYVPAAASVMFVIAGFCCVEVKPFGPVQLYVAPGMVSAVNNNEAPVQSGELLPATGVAGAVFTVTATVPALLVQPFTVTVSEYVPLAATVTPEIDGFCEADVNPFGPVHEYVAPATADVVKFNVAPMHTGLLLDAVGVAGIGLTVTAVVPATLVQPLTVIVTEYVPVASVVAAAIDGF